MNFHVLRFSGKSKKDLFQEVSMLLAVGYKKKKNIYIYILARDFEWKSTLETDFSASKSVFAFHFLLQICISKFLTRIYQSKAPRTLEPFSQYSQLFWTLLNRNMIIFIQSTILRLFDYLLRPSSTASFFKIGSSMSSLRVAVLSEGREGYGYTQANPCLHFLGNFLSDNNT